MELQELKQYLRVEYEEDDSLISSLALSAQSYIKNKTGKTKIKLEAIETDDLFKTCVKMLVAHWYENRGNEVAGSITRKYSHAVDAIIDHISICEDYKNG